MQNHLLLLKDVENVGRSGDVVTVRPGYARNFLLPQKMAVVADKHTLRMQAKLQEERAKQAIQDKNEATALSEKIAPMELSLVAKVDPDGHMYGSVSAADIVKLLAGNNINLDKKHVALPQPIKELGHHTIHLKLKEGVMVAFSLHIQSDKPIPQRNVEQQIPSA
jgi:large subunit ribosomal protein L9